VHSSRISRAKLPENSKAATIAIFRGKGTEVKWRHRWGFFWGGVRYRVRHLRRFVPIFVSLLILIIAWCPFVIGTAVYFGGSSLIWDRNFAQNVVASLLVLPIGLMVGVVAGAFLQTHLLRLQARQWGDRLCQRITTTTFGFLVYLARDCEFPVDLSGPTSSRFVDRAREAVIHTTKTTLPRDFEEKLFATAEEFHSCFTEASGLRLAFPLAFELAEDLQNTILEIKSGLSSSSPLNSTLTFLHSAAKAIRNLE
jgi:hypothetical protein